MSDDEVMAMVQSGAPVEFEIDGQRFGLRQMTPTERDKLHYLETRTRDRVLADYRADGLDQQPVSDEMQMMVDAYMASLEATYTAAFKAGEMDAAKQAARDMEDAPKNWPRNLAQERANAFVRRLDGRWALENLLDGDRAEFVRLTAPEPLSHDAVSEALARWQQLATFDPNSSGRRQ